MSNIFVLYIKLLHFILNITPIFLDFCILIIRIVRSVKMLMQSHLSISLFGFVFVSIIFNDLFERQSCTHPFSLLYSPNQHSSCGSVRWQPGTWNLNLCSHMGGRGPSAWASLQLLSQEPQQGAGSEMEQSGLELVLRQGCQCHRPVSCSTGLAAVMARLTFYLDVENSRWSFYEKRFIQSQSAFRKVLTVYRGLKVRHQSRLH